MNRRDKRNVLIAISVTIIIAIAWIVGIDALKAESAKQWTEPVITVSASELAEWNTVKASEPTTSLEVTTTSISQTTTELEETTTVPETVAETIPPTVQETEPVTVQVIPHYSIIENGESYTLDLALQDYTYQMCCEYGIEWYYPTMLAQMYQESNYHEGIVSSNGLDYGLCQLRITYHDYFRQQMGEPNLDFIGNSYDNIRGGVFLMASYIHQYGDVALAQTMYKEGTLDGGIYYPYVDIINHWQRLEVLE